jgi:peptidoglycan-associated lipoprotein
MRVAQFFGLLAAATIVAACGGGQDPEPVTPVADTTPRVNQDSIDAANRAADEERRRREAEEAERQRREAALAQVREDLAAPIHFEYDQADVRADDQQLLDRKAQILQANASVTLTVSGHADERGSDEYNLALGNRRAASAKRYLVSKGVEAARLETASFGEERPVAQGSDEEAYAQNRRAEFELTAGGDNLVAPQ